MTTENFFKDLPQGKSTGICQPPDSSVWKDGGEIVEIYEICKICSVSKCMMFTSETDDDGRSVKKYTPHKPAWKVI